MLLCYYDDDDYYYVYYCSTLLMVLMVIAVIVIIINFLIFFFFEKISRNATWLLIELTLNQEDAMVATIDEGRKFCNLTLKENDFPHGKVEFATDSRFRGLFGEFGECWMFVIQLFKCAK